MHDCVKALLILEVNNKRCSEFEYSESEHAFKVIYCFIIHSY